jgi:hypothetical protein
VDLNPGPVKPSPGLPLPLIECPDQGRPTCPWVVGPRCQGIYKGACKPKLVVGPNPTLRPVPIPGGVRQ